MSVPPCYTYYHSTTLIFLCPGGMSGLMVCNSLHLSEALLGNQHHFYLSIYFYFSGTAAALSSQYQPQIIIQQFHA